MRTIVPPSVETLAVALDALDRHVEAILFERNRRMEDRFNAQQSALQVATTALSEYKVSTNEWRGTMNDILSRQVPRIEYEAKSANLLDRIETAHSLNEANGTRISALEARGEARSASATIWVVILGLVVSLGLGVANLLRRVV